MAMSMSGWKPEAAILAALARMRLWTSLYVTRRCSGSDMVCARARVAEGEVQSRGGTELDLETTATRRSERG